MEPISDNIPLMDATFRCYQQVWHVNMVRMLIPVNWYWQNNIVPSMQDPTYYPDLTTPISYQTYIATVAAQAAKYGIYIDLCPYELVSNYQDSNSGGAQGQPMGTLGFSRTKLPRQHRVNGAAVLEPILDLDG